MQIRLLGPVDVVIDGVARPVPGLRRKAVLAALALQPGQIVSTDHLVEIVWDGQARAAAMTTLQSHMSYLRRLLGRREAIQAHRPGYVLAMPDEQPVTDLQAAQDLLGRADRLRDPQPAAAQLRAALDLWRGRSLADLSELTWFAEQAGRLEEIRLDAHKALVDARLQLGHHAALIREAEHLHREHPMDEQIAGHLMLALFRAGRQIDALAVYQNVRAYLDTELGVLPGARLRELHTMILREDSSLWAASPASDQTSAAHTPAPARAAREPPSTAPPGQPVTTDPPSVRTSSLRTSAENALPRRTGLAAVVAALMMLAGGTVVLPNLTGRQRPGANVLVDPSSSEVTTAGKVRHPATVATTPGQTPTPRSGTGIVWEAGQTSAPPVGAYAGGDDFDRDGLVGDSWASYDSVASNGSVFSPKALRVSDGTLQIVGSGTNASGSGNVSGGLCWCRGKDQLYGVWQVRARFDAGIGYAPQIGLWPYDESRAHGWLTLLDATSADRDRLTNGIFRADKRDVREVNGDFTAWHVYTLEWRPTFVRVYVDGRLSYDSTTSRERPSIPHVPEHLFIQLPAGPLDSIPGPDSGTPSRVVLYVDWVKMFR